MGTPDAYFHGNLGTPMSTFITGTLKTYVRSYNAVSRSRHSGDETKKFELM